MQFSQKNWPNYRSPHLFWTWKPSSENVGSATALKNSDPHKKTHKIENKLQVVLKGPFLKFFISSFRINFNRIGNGTGTDIPVANDFYRP